MAKKPKKEVAMQKVEAKQGNFLYILIYFFTWLSGLLVYLTEKEDKNIRFHAMQAILLGVIGTVLFWLIITIPISILLWLYGLYVGYKAYAGETVRVPYLAEYADKYM